MNTAFIFQPFFQTLKTKILKFCNILYQKIGITFKIGVVSVLASMQKQLSVDEFYEKEDDKLL